MMVINGQFPAPLIEANEGDTIIVNVQNTMATGTGFRELFNNSYIFCTTYSYCFSIQTGVSIDFNLASHRSNADVTFSVYRWHVTKRNQLV